jgi:hypothetical protein
VAPELLELEELLVEAAAVVELVVGSAVLVELAGVITAEVSWRMAGATVEVVVGAAVEVEVGVAVLELLDGQAAATAESSHSNSLLARPSQAFSMLMG